MSCAFQDVARFEPGDPPVLVEASFCCGCCLRRPALVVVGRREGGAHAWCYCAVCHAHTEVALDPRQLLRVTLAPPPDAPIHVMSEHAT